MAEKYCVQGFAEIAVTKFRNEAETHWNTEDFVQAAVVAYTATPDHVRPFRDAVVSVIRKRKCLLLKVELARDIEVLAYDVLVTGYGFVRNEQGVVVKPDSGASSSRQTTPSSTKRTRRA